MAQFEGYDEDALREQKRAESAERRKHNRGEFEWNNIEGEIVRLPCRKPKFYMYLLKRIQKEGPVFGLEYAGSDYKIEKDGTTYVFNEYTNTAKGYQNYKQSVSYIDVRRTFELKDERLINNCRDWFKILYKTPRAPVFFWIVACCSPVIILCGSIVGFSSGPSGIGVGIASIIIGLVLTFLFGFLAIRGSKKFSHAKNIVKSSKNIWRQLKADSSLTEEK